MLFYVRCPTCGRVLSKNKMQFNTEKKNIMDDPILSTEEKSERFSKLLDKYQYRNICCRVRIMGELPYHEIIVS